MAASINLCALVISVLLSVAAFAQQPATTVQLPTFTRFTVQTTVSVPDGGAAYLGGIDRGFDSSATRGFGPLGSRGLSGGRSTSGFSISATIIDHAEIDRAILAAAAGRESTGEVEVKAARIAADVNRSGVQATSLATSTNSLPGSVAAIRAANAAQDEARAQEVAGYLSKAEQAEAAGKTSVAKVYYQMVARSNIDQYRQQAAQRLAALAKAGATK